MAGAVSLVTSQPAPPHLIPWGLLWASLLPNEEGAIEVMVAKLSVVLKS